jgi:two-component system phosphate regulon sensor histidine kinase PhoR
MRPVDLAELTRELWRSLYSPITHPGYQVQLDVAEQAVVSADPDLLKTILTNLLSNALAYTPDGGKIQVSIYRKAASWTVSIANTSHELLATDLEHVFEPFWRKHADRGDAGHCGLGLALVAACARLMAIPIRTEIASNNLFVIAFECPAAA